MNTEIIEKDTGAVAEAEQEIILPFEKKGEFFIDPVTVKKKPFYSFVKRAFDIVASGMALLLLWLPMLIIAIAVKCDSKGPAFYSQERLGLNGKKIKIVKFRTMRVDAEKNGAQWSAGDKDDRITPFGAKLRKTRMDELPQLWCIFKGDLSIVGPRPERECFYNEFETYIHGFSERLKVKQGLTGHAQVNGGYNLKPEEKVLFDIEYINKRSLLLDLKIIFKTVKVVLTHNGAK